MTCFDASSPGWHDSSSHVCVGVWFVYQSVSSTRVGLSSSNYTFAINTQQPRIVVVVVEQLCCYSCVVHHGWWLSCIYFPSFFSLPAHFLFSVFWWPDHLQHCDITFHKWWRNNIHGDPHIIRNAHCEPFRTADISGWQTVTTHSPTLWTAGRHYSLCTRSKMTQKTRTHLRLSSTDIEAGEQTTLTLLHRATTTTTRLLMHITAYFDPQTSHSSRTPLFVNRGWIYFSLD